MPSFIDNYPISGSLQNFSQDGKTLQLINEINIIGNLVGQKYDICKFSYYLERVSDVCRCTTKIGCEFDYVTSELFDNDRKGLQTWKSKLI